MDVMTESKCGAVKKFLVGEQTTIEEKRVVLNWINSHKEKDTPRFKKLKSIIEPSVVWDDFCNALLKAQTDFMNKVKSVFTH
jgi:hypothetical protein